MTSDPRHDLRPPQRSRDGIPALDFRNPPLMRDVMIDRLDIAVRGAFGIRADEQRAGDLFDRYKHLMMMRATTLGHHWSAPASASDTMCRVNLKSDGSSTISSCSIRIEWARDRVNLALRIGLNPTRTLRHRAAELATDLEAVPELMAMSPVQFFARSDQLQPLQSADENDNVLPNLDAIRAALGDDFPTTFMPIFDGQLRRWAIDAVAPRQLGFVSQETESGIEATSGSDQVQLNWPQLTVRSIEAYFERRHAEAYKLIDRLAKQIPAGHDGAEWRRYGQNEVGGRRAGSEIVGLDLTGTIRQKYYAKTKNRVRAETVYSSAIRNALRITSRPEGLQVLSEVSSAIRNDTIRRCRWDEFCALCIEPPRATLGEVAHFLSSVVQAATSARVDPAPVLEALLMSGGIDQTETSGRAPSRLIRRLISAGIIEATGLRKRQRPHSQNRYRLCSAWLDAAERMQRAFVHDDQTVITCTEIDVETPR